MYVDEGQSTFSSPSCFPHKLQKKKGRKREEKGKMALSAYSIIAPDVSSSENRGRGKKKIFWPQPRRAIGSLIFFLPSVWQTPNQFLGKIDETGKKNKYYKWFCILILALCFTPIPYHRKAIPPPPPPPPTRKRWEGAKEPPPTLPPSIHQRHSKPRDSFTWEQPSNLCEGGGRVPGRTEFTHLANSREKRGGERGGEGERELS